MNREKVTRLAIDMIEEAPELWPRLGLDENRVAYLASLYSLDADLLPPLVAVPDKDRIVLADGHHRLEALRQLGADSALVQVIQPDPSKSLAEQVLLVAVDSAASAALPLKPKDRKRAVALLRAYCPHLSLTEIARRTGYTREGVSRLKKRLRETEGSSGPDREGRPVRSQSEDPVVLVGRLLEVWGQLHRGGRVGCGELMARLAWAKYADDAAQIVADLVGTAAYAREILQVPELYETDSGQGQR
jgi:hypothetical protein